MNAWLRLWHDMPTDPKWRVKVANLRRIASSGGKAAKAKRDAKKAETTERLRCGK